MATYGVNSPLDCFANLTQTGSSSFIVNGETAYRIQFINPSGTPVEAYFLPPSNTSVASGGTLGYSLTLSGNSTFSGVYYFAEFSGTERITGFAGINGTSYYRYFPSNSVNSISLRYLVPMGVSSPYMIGLTNTFGATQNVTIKLAMIATCGDSWLLQASPVS